MLPTAGVPLRDTYELRLCLESSRVHRNSLLCGSAKRVDSAFDIGPTHVASFPLFGTFIWDSSRDQGAPVRGREAEMQPRLAQRAGSLRE